MPEPAVALEISEVIWPFAFVVAVAGLMPSGTAPELLRTTAVLGTGVPPASLTVAVKVAPLPLVINAVVVDARSIVVPDMATGICEVTVPEVAVMVAVRLVAFPPPAANVTTTFPEASLTPLLAVRMPVVAEKETVTP